jgi:hypothetical protein
MTRTLFGIVIQFSLLSLFVDRLVEASVLAADQPPKTSPQTQISLTDDAKLTNKDSKDAPDQNKGEPEMTATRELLDLLNKQNASNDHFNDSWLETLKEIADLGPTAVPELIEELDATEDNMMMRCLGFSLRAIGDKRAIPALIRAIPKTLLPPGSDMGLSTNDEELLEFAQKFDLDEKNVANDYGFGRPVREICGALQTLTGKKFEEGELFHVFQGGLPSQRRLRQKLFHQTAAKWAVWWEQNWPGYVQDEKFAKVNLVTFNDEESIEPIAPDTHFRTTGGGSNWILESMFNPKARTVFYDLDIGRVAALPEKWRKDKDVKSHLEEILFWAAREGFDLMGTEDELPSGQRIFALKSIGLQVWELPEERWKMSSQDVTLEELKAEGRPADNMLYHYNPAIKMNEPLETASFLYITKHGTPGLLFVGIEVQDDSLKPGGISTGDNEMNPVAFNKGRRFGFTEFEIADN